MAHMYDEAAFAEELYAQFEKYSQFESLLGSSLSVEALLRMDTEALVELLGSTLRIDPRELAGLMPASVQPDTVSAYVADEAAPAIADAAPLVSLSSSLLVGLVLVAALLCAGAVLALRAGRSVRGLRRFRVAAGDDLRPSAATALLGNTPRSAAAARVATVYDDRVCVLFEQLGPRDYHVVAVACAPDVSLCLALRILGLSTVLLTLDCPFSRLRMSCCTATASLWYFVGTAWAEMSPSTCGGRPFDDAATERAAELGLQSADLPTIPGGKECIFWDYGTAAGRRLRRLRALRAADTTEADGARQRTLEGILRNGNGEVLLLTGTASLFGVLARLAIAAVSRADCLEEADVGAEKWEARLLRDGRAGAGDEAPAPAAVSEAVVRTEASSSRDDDAPAHDKEARAVADNAPAPAAVSPAHDPATGLDPKLSALLAPYGVGASALGALQEEWVDHETFTELTEADLKADAFAHLTVGSRKRLARALLRCQFLCDGRLPSRFVCPLTNETMRWPVYAIGKTAQSYEREALREARGRGQTALSDGRLLPIKETDNAGLRALMVYVMRPKGYVYEVYGGRVGAWED